MVADIEEMETMDASEIYSKSFNAKEVIFPKENGKFIFPVADGRIKLPDPEDITNARRKLATPMALAMLCKTCKKNKHGETRSKTNDFKSKFACILEASESKRLRVGESLPNYHEDHIARKRRQFIAALKFGS